MYFDVRAWPGRAPLSTVRRFRRPATSARPGPANRRHPTTSRPDSHIQGHRPMTADRDACRPRPTVRTGRATFPLRVNRRTSPVTWAGEGLTSPFETKCSRAPAIWRSTGAIVGSAGPGWMYHDVRAWPGRAPQATVGRLRRPTTSARPVPANQRHPTTSRPHRNARCPRQPPADRGVRRPRPTVRTGRATFSPLGRMVPWDRRVHQTEHDVIPTSGWRHWNTPTATDCTTSQFAVVNVSQCSQTRDWPRTQFAFFAGCAHNGRRPSGHTA